MLQNKVELLTTKVDILDTEVNSLREDLVKNQAALAISKITSHNLRMELDKQEQYSRRNCIVFDGIPSKRNDSQIEQTSTAKTILTETFPEDEEIATSFDKAHPIGPIKEGKQSFIMRFSKHSVIKRIYKNRHNINKGITVRPSLTKTRSATLKACQQSATSISSIKFVFSDIEGNLKVCFNDENLKNRSIHTFETEQDFRDLILHHEHSSDFPGEDELINNLRTPLK